MISNTTVQAVYTANGVTRMWPIPFVYEDNASIHLRVSDGEIEREIAASNFTVDDENLVVIYPKASSAPAVTNGYKVAVYRETDVTQEVDFTNQGGVWPETVEAALDKLTEITQEHEEQIARCAKVSLTDEETPEDYSARLWAAADAAIEAAGEAATSAGTAHQMAQEVADLYPQVLAAETAAIANINQKETTAINDIEVSKVSAVGDIQTAKTAAITDIETATGEAEAAAIADVQAAGERATAEVEEAAEASAAAAAASATAAANSATTAEGAAEDAEEIKREIIDLAGDKFGFRQPNTAYAVEDMAFFTLHMSIWYIECITAGTTGSGDLVITNPQPNQIITDGTVTWQVRKQSSTGTGTDTVPGLTKLYTSTGDNTDGTMTQAAISEELNDIAGDVGAATSNISSLQDNMTTARGNIGTLQNDVATVQTNIADLQNALSMTYKAKGSISFNNLPATLSSSLLGWVYNIYDDFTTDSRFVEGAGNEYFAGENVVVVELSPDEYVLTADETAIAGKTYYADAQGGELVTQPTGGDFIGEAGYYEYVIAHYELTKDTTAQSGKTYYADDEGTALPTQPTAGADISEAGYYEYVEAGYVLTADQYAKAGKSYYADDTGTALDNPPTGGDDISQAGYYEFHTAVYKYDVLSGYINLTDYPRVASFDATTATLTLTTL